MKTEEHDLVIIGGGPAGMAAAIAASDFGVNSLVLERDKELGGILQQCIHPGFGLHVFDEELTGPEFGERYKDKVLGTNAEIRLETIVTDIDATKKITVYHPEQGLYYIKASVIILTMGARERTRGAIRIPGGRPAGVYTAGLAQRLINIEGKMPGKEYVILGSGDIGMIMARRLSLEGAKVHKVVEILPYPSGLLRNKVQCLDDFGIPLLLSHTITHIHGNDRLEAVTIAQVDEKWQPIPGTEETVPCDTLLLSVGLIPEIDFALGTGIELSSTGGPVVNEMLETTVPGIFACGNVLHIHDLVDNVVLEGAKAGAAAAKYLREERTGEGDELPVVPGEGVLYVLPQKIQKNSLEEQQMVHLRVRKPAKKLHLGVFSGDRLLKKSRFAFAMPSEMITLNVGPFEQEQICDVGLEVRVISMEDHKYEV